MKDFANFENIDQFRENESPNFTFGYRHWRYGKNPPQKKQQQKTKKKRAKYIKIKQIKFN